MSNSFSNFEIVLKSEVILAPKAEILDFVVILKGTIAYENPEVMVF